MKWNWQQPDWPDFRWNSEAPAVHEARFLQQSGIMIGVVKHLADEDRTSVVLDVMTDEAMKTSQIEGELLNRDSVQSSLRREFGLETEARRIPPAERGIAEMMMALYRDFAAPLTEEARRRHRLVLSGRSDIDDSRLVTARTKDATSCRLSQAPRTALSRTVSGIRRGRRLRGQRERMKATRSFTGSRSRRREDFPAMLELFAGHRKAEPGRGAHSVADR